MKIAVCISGQPRTIAKVWKLAYTNFLSQIGDHDLFVHSSEQYLVSEEFWSHFKPVIYRVEQQFPLPAAEEALRDVFFCQPHLNNYLQQVYAYKRVWQLKELYEKDTDTSYDLVVRTRPDVEYHQPLSLDLFNLENLNLFPRSADPDRTQCFTDIFTLGPDALMRKFCHIYDWIITDGNKLRIGDKWTDKLPEEHAQVMAGRYSPESILNSFLEDQGVPATYAKVAFEEVMSLMR